MKTNISKVLYSKVWGYIAATALLPYAGLKTLWAFGIALGFSEYGISELHVSMKSQSGPVIAFLYSIGVDITALLACAASILGLSLVQPWGKKAARRLILIPAWLGGLAFIYFGLAGLYLLMTSGPEDMYGMQLWVFILVYGGFFVWGLAVTMAAISYQLRGRMKRTITKDLSEEYENAFERFTKKSVWPAYVGFLWALLYAVFVRFYTAAGGTFEMIAAEAIRDSANMANYFAGVLILFCGFVLLGLVKPWTRVIPVSVPLFGGIKIHPLLILIPTLFCTAFLIAHGTGGMLTKIMYFAGIIRLNLPHWSEAEMRSFALWDLLLYEPWFLIMGILSGLTAAHYAQASGVSLPVLRRGTVLYLSFVFLLTSFFVIVIVFDLVDKFTF
ncbi:hypothetical protein [Paenibacillus hamazuiensis]|uniref:hypothetical protein n=1 Tax=Paenibacillus hamazuiensis TaxID=2936508 RepID=UPI00200EFD6F|nr:hypothetical protein [Paenibacillus hamazuiensis]